MSERIQKINALIQQQMSEIFARDLSIKLGIFVTITKVDTIPDLRYTRVFVSVFPEKEMHYVSETLKKERLRMQKTLHKRLHMKPLPKITFILDNTEAEADKIEKILLQL